MEFLYLNELSILRWIHILAMVYWLGGEWGVFQTSYHVTNSTLSLEERRRHMETAYRIDILARTGIVLLLPLGLHMGKIYGFVPLLDGDRGYSGPVFEAEHHGSSCVVVHDHTICTQVGANLALTPDSPDPDRLPAGVLDEHPVAAEGPTGVLLHGTRLPRAPPFHRA